MNRVEINDEGVRVLVEIEGLSAVRAAQVISTVLAMALRLDAGDQPANSGGVIEKMLTRSEE